jgi:hypothetical protein
MGMTGGSTRSCWRTTRGGCITSGFSSRIRWPGTGYKFKLPRRSVALFCLLCVDWVVIDMTYGVVYYRFDHEQHVLVLPFLTHSIKIQNYLESKDKRADPESNSALIWVQP